jgi:hypothetical protein
MLKGCRVTKMFDEHNHGSGRFTVASNPRTIRLEDHLEFS